MSLNKLKLPSSGVVAVVGLQWGDEGKGKVVDLFAQWADITARGTGGANAGHTIVVGGDSYVFHLVPSAILRDAEGMTCVIGRGVALDAGVLLDELALLDTLGVSYGNLKISRDAHLVLPHHKVLDRVREENAGDGKKIGTTGKGIGPVYTDHVSRYGLFVRDMLNPDSFREKLIRVLGVHQHELHGLAEHVREAMNTDEQLRDMCCADASLDVDRIVKRYCEFGEQLRPYIVDTDSLLQSAIASGKRVLLEGAQATLLSIDHGLYPMVTSSDSTIDGLCKGVGISRTQVDRVFGVVKAPYMTRVGSGVFPTQIDGEMATAIRTAGNEFGATTGRARRIGWLDLPLLRYAVQFGADCLVLTKSDVLSNCAEIKICTGYKYVGPDYDLGDQVLQSEHHVDMALGDDVLMKDMQPVFEVFPGWLQEITHLRSGDTVPPDLQRIIKFISDAVGRPVAMLSVGPERDQIVCL